MPNFVHPELLDDEVFFTNANSADFRKMSWITKRKGEKAYDGRGNLLKSADWFPVFLKKQELNNQTISEVRRTWRELLVLGTGFEPM